MCIAGCLIHFSFKGKRSYLRLGNTCYVFSVIRPSCHHLEVTRQEKTTVETSQESERQPGQLLEGRDLKAHGLTCMSKPSSNPGTSYGIRW